MQNPFTSPWLYAGLLIGILTSSYFAPRKPTASKTPVAEVSSMSADFGWLSEAQLAEYYELKSMRERYERADELLGKMVLALIAGKFIDFSTATSAKLQASANGRALQFPPPVCEAKAAPAQAVAAPPPPLPAKEKRDFKKRIIGEESPYQQAQPGETESFPFAKMASYKTTMCDGESDWFVTSGFKSYFSAEPDPDDENTDLVGTISSSSLQRSELTLLHCLKPNYKSWRVKITAQVKADNVRNGKMIIKKWNPDGSEARASNQINISGTFDWKPFSMPVIVSGESFAFGFEMVGSGKLFLKDVKVLRMEDTYLHD